jgi:type VI protein secretion system component Hcp
LTAAKLSNELRPEDLERVVGGLTVSKVSDASSPKLLTTVGTGPEPSPPKSIDVFQFVQAFA